MDVFADTLRPSRRFSATPRLRDALVAALVFLACASRHHDALAQAIAPTPVQSGVGASGGPVGIPRTNLAPIDPSANFGTPAPAGDPYAAQPQPQGVFGNGIAPSQPGSSLFSRIFSRPAATPSGPAFTPAPTVAPNQGFANPGFSNQGFANPGLATSPGIAPVNPGVNQGFAPNPGFATPIAPAPTAPGIGSPGLGSAGLGAQPFGTPAPYNPGAGGTTLGQPGLIQPAPIQPGYPQPGFAQPMPGFAQPGYAQPGFGQAAGYGQPNYGYVQPGYGQPNYPTSIYPSNTPQTLYPGGLFGGNSQWINGPGITASAYRLFQGPRFQHTFVNASGSRPYDLQTNDTDVSLVFAVPRFFYSSQPLFIIPSFSLHLWDGPDGIIGADLPPNAYSAFLDFGWESNPNAMVGTEFGLRLGVFTDFKTYNKRSFRTLGKGLVHFRMSPTCTVRGGVYYVDRVTVKLIPAVGILYQPNPLARYDFFFPKPKFSRYLRTVGTRDVWWYLGGDFGGGSWTIKRTDGTEDSIDINELRVAFGIETGFNEQLRLGRRKGFFEVGYAFKREVKYRLSPFNDFDPRDNVWFRLGFGY